MQSTVPRGKPLTARIGIYGVGHHTYWLQFDGLLNELERKLSIFENRVHSFGVDVVNFGISDCAETIAKKSQLNCETIAYVRWGAPNFTFLIVLMISHI